MLYALNDLPKSDIEFEDVPLELDTINVGTKKC